MGLFSSKSRSTSNQTTNNTSTNFGIQGDNNGFITNGDGNTYNIEQTDYGLVSALESISGNMTDSQIAGFDFARDATTGAQDMALDMTSGAFDFASNVNRDSLDSMYGLATDSIDAQNSLTRYAIAENGALADSLMSYTSEANARLSDLTMYSVDAADKSNARMSDLAMYSVDAADNSNARMSDVAVYSMDNASNLARDLGAQVIDATQDAYNQLGDRSALATKQALQFANDMSRSDGQQLAISTNKTMMYIVLGLAGLGIAVALITTRPK